MQSARKSRLSPLLIIHVGVIAAMFATLSLAPPAQGKMLLVPFGAETASDLLRRAIAAGALLVDHGPIAGSLIVEGDRAALSPAIGHVLILAAPRSGCTETESPA